MSERNGRTAFLTLEDSDTMQKICHALSSPIRIEIVRLLGYKSMGIGRDAEELDIPISTAAQAVRVLKDAGLIITENQPGMRGTLRLCTRMMDRVMLNLVPQEDVPAHCLTLCMPIGGYSAAQGIVPTCGLADLNGYIGPVDTPAAFYLPGRFGAQIIWMQRGFLEYHFSVVGMQAGEIEWLEISFEACSEAPMYRDPWKSDIAVEVNGRRLGVWTSPCDCGGRHGFLTPEWWLDTSTQFGFLKTWRVDGGGSYLDGKRIGDVTIGELAIDPERYIGVAPDAVHAGGMNIFGDRFGDYPQALQLRVGYAARE